MQQLMQQVKNDPQMVQRVMQSPDGQKLMQMLTSSDNGASLDRAAASATATVNGSIDYQCIVEPGIGFRAQIGDFQ